MCNDENRRHYGLLFIVGDVRNSRVHGFYIIPGKKEFITVNEDEVIRIGVSKVRSKDPVSPKWASDYL